MRSGPHEVATAEELGYGTGDTPFGRILVVWSAKGLCALRLIQDGSVHEALQDLEREFSGAEFSEDPAQAKNWIAQIKQVLVGRLNAGGMQLDLHGTPFQKRVWHALLRVPRGSTCSYSELARRAGYPRAVRAVGSACAHNPLGLIVPCHRIVRSDGGLGGYGWGLQMKRRILRAENVEV
jgi:AraC family transcriptional regulator of adaptative response/methylated-DNA-[protein]-cysteine methyltransferase